MSNDGDSSFQNSAQLIAAGTLLSRILGFVRDLLMATFFDRFLTDCFVVAFRLPNFFRRIMGEGALASSVIPQLTSTFVNQKPSPQSQHYLSTVWSAWCCGLLLLNIVGVMEAPQILSSLVGGKGFQGIPGKLQTVQHMGQIMFPFMGLISVAAFATALLQSQNRFFVAAFAPLIFNLVLIGSLFIGPQWISWAVLAGGALHVLLLWPQLLELKPRFTWHFDKIVLRRFASAFAPNVLSAGSLQLIGLFNLYFASQLTQGAHSYLYWVDRLLEFPMSLVGVSLGSALLPRLSQAFSEKRDRDFEALAQSALTSALFWTMPFIIGMLFLSEPVIQLLFERGQFTQEDTLHTATLLKIASLTLLSGTLMRTLQPILYAIHQPQVAAVLSVITVAVHAILGSFATSRFGLQGLAWSTALSTTAHFLLTLIYLRKTTFLLPAWRFIVASLPLIFSALGYPWLAASLSLPTVLLTRAGALIVSAGFGFFCYLVSCELLGVSEFAMIKISREDNP